MPSVGDSLYLVHSPDLVRVKRPATGAFREWLRVGTYEPTARGGELVLTRTDWSNFLLHAASDVNRLSLAARETIQNIIPVPNFPSSTAWSLIKAYYSAFYHAQVILRLCRRSFVYLRTSELQPLISLISAYGFDPPFNLGTAQYLITSVDGAKEVKICRCTGSGGTHEMMWKEFYDLISTTEVVVGGSGYADTERTAMIADLRILKKAATGASSGNVWLSSLRNDVQYAQKLGVWYPYNRALQSTSVERKVAALLSDDVRIADFDLMDPDASANFLNCCFVVCFAARTFIRSLTGAGHSSFLDSGFLRLEQTLQGGGPVRR